MLTVRDLERILQDLQDEGKITGDTPIALNGYEGGYYEPDSGDTFVETLVLDVNCEWYYGPHEKEESHCAEERKDHKRETYLIIGH